MKKRGKVAMLVVIFILLFFGCDQGTGASGVDADIFWSKQDLLSMDNRVKSMGGILLSYKISLRMKPPFYNGKMPLEYISLGKNIGGGISGIGSVVFCHDFGSWRNLFIYNDTMDMYYGMPAGAVTVDNRSDKIIAECKVLQNLNENDQLSGFELMEKHYNARGEAIFVGKFKVDFHEGFKTSETDTKGKKERDYFFIWPTGLSAGF